MQKSDDFRGKICKAPKPLKLKVNYGRKIPSGG